METGYLISDLGIVLICAALVTLLFKRLRLPVFLGYVLSGFLVGPNFLPNSPIHDLATVNSLSELGVVFLMFYIGLEFDLGRLRKVFAPSMVAVLIQTVVLIYLGILVAPLLGWNGIEGLFLGSLLAISSSMITIAVLQSLNETHKAYAQYTIGVLILEDILAISLLVLLSGVAISGSLKWLAIGKVTFAIAVFTAGVMVGGKFVARRLVFLLERYRDTELITICSVALMLALGILAIDLHLSVALGAFLAGSLLSQSSISEHIEHTTEPLRNVFCAVFFVSAGMLIEPSIIVNEWPILLLLSILVVFIKVATVWIGLFLTGNHQFTSFRAAVVKAQIGEFSFVIAGLAQSLKVADSGLMSLAIGVSVITTILSLSLSMKANTVYGWMAKRMPESLVTLGEFYNNLSEDIGCRLGGIVLWKLLRRPLLQVLTYFLVFNAVVFSSFFLNRYLNQTGKSFADEWMISVSVWAIAALLCIPLISSVIRNLNAMVLLITDALFGDPATRYYLRGRMLNIFTILIVTGLVVVVGGAYLSAVSSYLPKGYALAAFALLLIFACVFFWKRIIALNSRLEYLFMESFNQRIREEEYQRERITMDKIIAKYPWPVKVVEFVLPALSRACGTPIFDLRSRGNLGAPIIAVSRNGHTHYNPEPNTRLFPYDRIFLFGDEEQTDAAVSLLSEERDSWDEPTQEVEPQIEKVFIPKDSVYVDKTLADSQLRKKSGVTVLGIQRKDERITAPSPKAILKAEDVLYTIGNHDAIKELQDNHPRVVDERKAKPFEKQD